MNAAWFMQTCFQTFHDENSFKLFIAKISYLAFNVQIHRESKKGATLTMAITLSILDGFAKSFHCYKEQ